MNNDWGLDFTGKTFADVERENGTVPNGFYLARVTGTREENQNSTVRQAFDFEITSGPFAGRKVTDSLMQPKFAATPEKQLTAANRCKLFAIRLGAVTPDAQGKANAAPNWPATVGCTCIIQVNARTYEKKDARTGEVTGTGHATGLAFNGVYQLGSPDVDAATRTKFGLPPLGAVVCGSPMAGNGSPAPTANVAPPSLWGAKP